MGDDGQLYVAGEVVPVYKSIIPYADIIIPNQFEAELLSNRKLDSLDDITAFLRRLHEIYRVKHVVISSIQLASHPGFILCCGSTATSTGQPRPFVLKAPIIEGYFVGTGDLFAALLLARLSPYIGQLIPADDVSAIDLPLTKALELVIASVQAVLKSTKVAMNTQLEEDGDLSNLTKKEKQVKIMRAAELRLVQNQDALVHPVAIIRALAL